MVVLSEIAPGWGHHVTTICSTEQTSAQKMDGTKPANPRSKGIVNYWINSFAPLFAQFVHSLAHLFTHSLTQSPQLIHTHLSSHSNSRVVFLKVAKLCNKSDWKEIFE